MKTFQALLSGILLTLLLTAAIGEGYDPWFSFGVALLLVLSIIVDQLNQHFEKQDDMYHQARRG